MPDVVTELPKRPTRRLRKETLAPPDSDSSATEPAVAQEALLRRVQAHDPEGRRLLLELYGPVHSWCRRWGLQAADIADTVQGVFCALMRRVDRFHPDQADGLRGWLWTITQNKLRDHHRRQARVQRTGGDCYEQLLSVPAPEPPVAAAPGELFHWALLVLRAEFEERTWMAFWRSLIDEQASTDVGRELDMTANAVRKAKARVLERLREALAGEAVSDGGG
jgi:RNA polymerase sigma-70 factor (ECF subfamily)